METKKTDFRLVYRATRLRELVGSEFILTEEVKRKFGGIGIYTDDWMYKFLSNLIARGILAVASYLPKDRKRDKRQKVYYFTSSEEFLYGLTKEDIYKLIGRENI